MLPSYEAMTGLIHCDLSDSGNVSQTHAEVCLHEWRSLPQWKPVGVDWLLRFWYSSSQYSLNCPVSTIVTLPVTQLSPLTHDNHLLPRTGLFICLLGVSVLVGFWGRIFYWRLVLNSLCSLELVMPYVYLPCSWITGICSLTQFI